MLLETDGMLTGLLDDAGLICTLLVLAEVDREAENKEEMLSAKSWVNV